MLGTAISVLAALAAAVTPAAALREGGNLFVLFEVDTLTMARMDPIVMPGQIGGHNHIIMGASNFRSVLNTPEEQQRADCTTAVIGADKSNYWTPELYYIHDNGTYTAMTSTGTRIYYIVNNDDVVPFPKGMRMVSGTSNSRYREDPRTWGNLHSCGETEQGPYMPNGTTHSYCDSIHTGIKFPSCGWANQSLDSWDHQSHLTWPHYPGADFNLTSPHGYLCPESHPVHYPAIFIQHFYWFNKHYPWRAGHQNVILSNGDTTGLSYHGDFVNGWDDKVLKDAIEHLKSRPDEVGDQIQTIPSFAPSFSKEAPKKCQYAGQLPNEDVGIYRPIHDLPGCNPVWDANGPASRPTPNCGDTSPGFVNPNVVLQQGIQNYIPLVLPEVVDKPESVLEDMKPWYNYPNFLWRHGNYGDNKDRVMSTGTLAVGPRSDKDKVFGMQDDSTYAAINPDGSGTRESIGWNNYNPPIDWRNPDGKVWNPNSELGKGPASSAALFASTGRPGFVPAPTGAAAPVMAAEVGKLNADPVPDAEPAAETMTGVAAGDGTGVSGVGEGAVSESVSASAADATPSAGDEPSGGKHCKRSRSRRASRF